MKILKSLKRWLDGANICPRCGALHHKMSFGFTKMICPDCREKDLKERRTS